MEEKEENHSLQSLWLTSAGKPGRPFIDRVVHIGISIERIDPYFKGDIIVNGVLKEVRGRAKIIITNAKDHEDIDIRLKNADLRIWTQEERDAYELLEEFNVGGINFKKLPTSEDLQEPSQ